MLDIKSKNNKFKNLIVSLLVIATAAIGFMSLYNTFGKEAAARRNAEARQEESYDDEAFLNRIFTANYMLNKDVKEKAGEIKLEYADLYLEGSGFNEGEEELYRQDIQAAIESREADILENLLQRLDYCVIDDETGTVLKNTGNTPEKLLDKNAEWETPYIFYLKMSYDKAGNVQNIALKSRNADTVLKRVQAYARNNILEDYTAEDTIKIGAPKNITVIYAVTEAQKGVLEFTNYIEPAEQNTEWDIFLSYSRAGVADTYIIFLMLLAVIALLLPKYGKKYELYRYRWCRLPLEVLAVIGIIIFSSGNLVVDLVVNSNQDYFFHNFNAAFPAIAFPSVTGAGYLALKFMMNFAALGALFGIWFWCVISLGDIYLLGMKNFFRQRSLLYQGWICTKGYWKNLWNRGKESLLHTDLSKSVNKKIFRIVVINFIVLFLICCTWFIGIWVLLVYSLIVFILIRQYVESIQEQYIKLLSATKSIAEGNLSTELKEDLGIFEAYGTELDKIQEGFKYAVEEEVKSQKMKTELITNVSHDLKTPLTAIITYTDLLKDENLTEEERRSYIDTLEKKSLRLKVLIEDLFEISKAESKNVSLTPVPMDICNLIKQVYSEHMDKWEELGIEFKFHIPEEKVILELDSQKTYRIFENLYTNIIKYAMPHTRVYFNAEKTEKGIIIEIKNISATELNIAPEELTERFVRGDSSRNTEGSGLGLAIARSFVELQGGTMKVGIDGDLFKVKIEF